MDGLGWDGLGWDSGYWMYTYEKVIRLATLFSTDCTECLKGYKSDWV